MEKRAFETVEECYNSGINFFIRAGIYKPTKKYKPSRYECLCWFYREFGYVTSAMIEAIDIANKNGLLSN